MSVGLLGLRGKQCKPAPHNWSFDGVCAMSAQLHPQQNITWNPKKCFCNSKLQYKDLDVGNFQCHVWCLTLHFKKKQFMFKLWNHWLRQHWVNNIFELIMRRVITEVAHLLFPNWCKQQQQQTYISHCAQQPWGIVESLPTCTFFSRLNHQALWEIPIRLKIVGEDRLIRK